MLTTTSVNAGTVRLTGSLNTSPCGGMSILDLPPKVSAINMPGITDEPDNRVPMDAGPMVSVAVPKAFENFTRTESPLMLANIGSRTVVPAGKLLAVAPGSRPGPAHVVNQPLPAAQTNDGVPQRGAQRNAAATASRGHRGFMGCPP